MPTEDRFKQAVVVTLAKRAANRCSNPDCGAITSGPSDDRDGSVNVGEAAHIYGANPGSARYDQEMTPADRSAITNALWLCSNCHKLVDDDPERYPAGLLFEWQREHERNIAEQVGKTGAELRRRYEDRHLDEFGRLSYLAERIILEKGDFWEYRLTAEVLRFEMGPVLRRWDALKRRLYVKSNYRVSRAEFLPWMQTRISEISQITYAFSELMNVEFDRAWKEVGTPGSDTHIVSVCRLFSGVCASTLGWEETVRFANSDHVFEDVRELFVGIGGRFIDEAAKLPEHLGTVFANNPAPGEYPLDLALKLPDGWGDSVESAIARATKSVISGIDV